MSDLPLPSLLCPCPGANVGPPPRASWPSGLWSVSQGRQIGAGVGERRWVYSPEFPSGCLRLASTEGLPLWRWPLCPLSLPHLCLLATASFSSPQDEGRSGSLAFTSLGCTCGFHMSLPCLCLKTKHHRV